MAQAVPISRRTLLGATASALMPMQGHAQSSWPTKPIRLIVPFAPGGSNDNISRLIATKLGARLGQPVIVENKGGAGGTIGTEIVAKSAPDGYTLLFASTSITTNAASGKKVSYDLVKDLDPIGEIGSTPFAVVVSNDVKANTLSEFIALARAKPRSINYGTAGIGGINHLGTELLASAARIQLVHVPYKGTGPAFTDLMGGNLQMLLPSLTSVMPFIRAGSMRALAVTSSVRSPLAPELPTVSEAGLAGFKLEVWFGLLGPANLPAPIMKRLNDELVFMLAQPDVKETLAREGCVAQPGTPKEFGILIKSEIDRWSHLIKDNNIQVE